MTNRPGCACMEGMTTPAEPGLSPFVRQAVVLLTTYKRDGTGVGTAVNIAVDGDHAYVRTYSSSGRPSGCGTSRRRSSAPPPGAAGPPGPPHPARLRLLDPAYPGVPPRRARADPQVPADARPRGAAGPPAEEGADAALRAAADRGRGRPTGRRRAGVTARTSPPDGCRPLAAGGPTGAAAAACGARRPAPSPPRRPWPP